MEARKPRPAQRELANSWQGLGQLVHHGATCEPAAAQQRGAHTRDWEQRPRTEAATKPGGWQGLGLGHSPESRGRRAHGGGPGAGCAPVHRFSSSSPALHLSAPRPWLRLRLALAAGRAGFGRRLSAVSPVRRLWCGPAPPAPPAPPSQLCAGSVAAARSAPARWAPRLLGAEATPQPSLWSFLRSGNRGQDLRASKDREEKSDRSGRTAFPRPESAANFGVIYVWAPPPQLFAKSDNSYYFFGR